MPDRFPFMLAAITTVVPGAKVNISRLIEAFIIAGITASVSLYGVTKVLETKMTALESRLIQVETAEKANTDTLKSDLREVRIFIDQHVLLQGRRP